MRDSVPSGSYSSVCNVLRQWKSRSSLLIESTDSMIPQAGKWKFIVNARYLDEMKQDVYQILSYTVEGC